MQDQSYYVHLESLKDFVRELETQIHAMSKPNDFLLTLSEQPLLFGEFGEAGSLTKAHQAAVAEMQGLLDQVKGAITFAQEVTTTVADGYAAADESVAVDMNHAGQQTGLLDPLLNVLGGVLGGTGGSHGGGNKG
ncbi:hypothetical protein [Amycolatopsis regifaucium]|uniref:PE domain-containing protein n=1 Tax=Amycolatopsis regifaucium TaxID=546365 RepID=A0A154MN58_9PSEU|nr:hypothetical protein [Amycolatopsis regifaucium]KZB85656.1 hypothetical protein AVL48_29795 [Amycolatopsis regifaucium]OKA10590.1 hypothetical protein ATP06_0204115 [Amycolatopsis regifaucium]SFI83340.1 hypothetical protein SAMN04489731_113194 [Amycolatopsis regifaucium]